MYYNDYIYPMHPLYRNDEEERFLPFAIGLGFGGFGRPFFGRRFGRPWYGYGRPWYGRRFGYGFGRPWYGYNFW